jgi:anti-sigma B factor antagonist
MIYSSWTAARAEGMCVYVTGEVDLSVSAHLYEVLCGALGQALGPLEVNLYGLQFLDCAGIAALLRARDDAGRWGSTLFVSEPCGIVRRALALTGVLTVLTADGPAESSRPFGAGRGPLEARNAPVRTLPIVS